VASTFLRPLAAAGNFIPTSGVKTSAGDLRGGDVIEYDGGVYRIVTCAFVRTGMGACPPVDKNRTHP
jgi:hypothetical protein